MNEYISKRVGQVKDLNSRFGTLVDPKLAETETPTPEVANLIRVACRLQTSIEAFMAKHNREPHLAPISNGSAKAKLLDLSKQMLSEAFLAQYGYNINVAVAPETGRRVISVISSDGSNLASAEFSAPPGIEKIVRFDDGESLPTDIWTHVYHLDPHCSETIHRERGVLLEDDPSLKVLWNYLSELRFIDDCEDLSNMDIAEADSKKVYPLDNFTTSFVMNYISDNALVAKAIAHEVSLLKQLSLENAPSYDSQTQFAL